uniref:Uncharacterized protein n=1 Tax=Triticum urartu TaxID=4572 RepID=A0A8R7Q4C3_TRIUA
MLQEAFQNIQLIVLVVHILSCFAAYLSSRFYTFDNWDNHAAIACDATSILPCSEIYFQRHNRLVKIYSLRYFQFSSYHI